MTRSLSKQGLSLKRNRNDANRDFFIKNAVHMLLLSDNRNMKDLKYLLCVLLIQNCLMIYGPSDLHNTYTQGKKTFVIAFHLETSYLKKTSDSYLNLLQLPNPINPNGVLFMEILSYYSTESVYIHNNKEALFINCPSAFLSE